MVYKLIIEAENLDDLKKLKKAIFKLKEFECPSPMFVNKIETSNNRSI